MGGGVKGDFGNKYDTKMKIIVLYKYYNDFSDILNYCCIWAEYVL